MSPIGHDPIISARATGENISYGTTGAVGMSKTTKRMGIGIGYWGEVCMSRGARLEGEVREMVDFGVHALRCPGTTGPNDLVFLLHEGKV